MTVFIPLLYVGDYWYQVIYTNVRMWETLLATTTANSRAGDHAILQDKSPNASRRTRTRRGVSKSQWGNVQATRLNVDGQNPRRHVTSVDSKENAAAEKVPAVVKNEGHDDKSPATHTNEPSGDTVSAEGKDKCNPSQRNIKSKTNNPSNDEKKHPKKNNKRHSSSQQDPQSQAQAFAGLLPPATPLGFPPLFGMYNPAAPQIILPNLAALYGMPMTANNHYKINGNESPSGQQTEQHQIPQNTPVISYAPPPMPDVVNPQLLEACTAEFKRVSQQIADLDRYMALRTFAMEPGAKKMLVEQRIGLVKRLDKARWMKEIVERQLQFLEEIKPAGEPHEGAYQTGIPGQDACNINQHANPGGTPSLYHSYQMTTNRHHQEQDEAGSNRSTGNRTAHSHSDPGTDAARTWRRVTDEQRNLEQNALREKSMADVPDEIKDLHRKLEKAIEAKDNADLNPILEELSRRIKDLKMGGLKEQEQVKDKSNAKQSSMNEGPPAATDDIEKRKIQDDAPEKDQMFQARQSQASLETGSLSGSGGKSESTTAVSKINAYGTTTKPAKRDDSEETKDEEGAGDVMLGKLSNSRLCEHDNTSKVFDTLLNWFRPKSSIKG